MNTKHLTPDPYGKLWAGIRARAALDDAPELEAVGAMVWDDELWSPADPRDVERMCDADYISASNAEGRHGDFHRGGLRIVVVPS